MNFERMPAESEKESKEKRGSGLKRKILAGGLAAASIAGVAGTAETASAQEVKKGDSRHVETLKYERPNAASKALIAAGAAELERGNFSELKTKLPGIISEIEKRNQFAALLSRETGERQTDGEHAGSDNANTKSVEGEKQTARNLEGAKGAFMDSVDYAIQAGAFDSLKTVLPQTIETLKKELRMAEEMDRQLGKH